MDWKYFSGRRRTTLKDFLSDCGSEEEALQKFADWKIEFLPHEEIKQYFSESKESQIEAIVETSAEAPVDNVDALPVMKNTVKKVTKNATETPGS